MFILHSWSFNHFMRHEISQNPNHAKGKKLHVSEITVITNWKIIYCVETIAFIASVVSSFSGMLEGNVRQTVPSNQQIDTTSIKLYQYDIHSYLTAYNISNDSLFSHHPYIHIHTLYTHIHHGEHDFVAKNNLLNHTAGTQDEMNSFTLVAA